MRREIREANPRKGKKKKKIYSFIGQGDYLASLYPTILAIQMLTPTFSHPTPNLSTSSF